MLPPAPACRKALCLAGFATGARTAGGQSGPGTHEGRMSRQLINEYRNDPDRIVKVGGSVTIRDLHTATEET